MAVDKSFLNAEPDIIVLTHDHLDHTDPDTLSHYLGENTGVLVLASANAWSSVRKFGGNNRYVMFNSGSVWTEGKIRFTAVSAEHSDTSAIGVILEAADRKYYITGDTLYNKRIFKDLPDDIFALFLPINGVGNNMNMTDADGFAKVTAARHVVPVHWGMFDSINPGEMKTENKIIPEIYKEIRL